MMKSDTAQSRSAAKKEKVTVPLRLNSRALITPYFLSQRTLGFTLIKESESLRGIAKSEKLREADTAFQGAISITPAILHSTLKAAREAGFDNQVLAPYEADPQLAFLCATGRADGIITEDSDLLVYSILSPRPFPILLKMDAYGKCTKLVVDLSTVDQCDDQFVKKLACFDQRMFTQMALLAGCDYISNLPGVGLLTAQKLVLRARFVRLPLARTVHPLLQSR